MSKTAVMAFGRFNPPTVGHEKLIKKVSSVAKDHDGSAHVFASHSQGSAKNPLDQKYKNHLLGKVANPHSVQVHGSSKEEPTFLHAAKKLHQAGHEHLVMVAGSDRVKDYEDRLKKYNGHPDHYNFKSIKVVSAGHRDPDAEGTTGMSGTKMRELAHAGKHGEFKKGLPKTIQHHASDIADRIRNIKEEFMLNEEIQDLLEAVDVRQRLKRRLIMRRYGAKMKRQRAIARERMAKNPALVRRANKRARQILRVRVAANRGREYNKLNMQQKVAIDKLLDSKKALVSKVAKRIMPKVKRDEMKRLAAAKAGKGFKKTSKSAGTIVAHYETDGPMLSEAELALHLYENTIMEQQIIDQIIPASAAAALIAKAEKHGIDVDTIAELYARGIQSWEKLQLEHVSPQQHAFARVNSFIAYGKAREMDADLNEISSATLKSYQDKAIEDSARKAWKSGTEKAEGRTKNAEKLMSKAMKRASGIAKAGSHKTEMQYKKKDTPPFEGGHKRTVHKDEFGNVVKDKNIARFLARKGRASVSEEVEVVESAHQALKDYGTKSGGIDKKDFHIVAGKLANHAETGNPGVVADAAKHIRGMDTDPRDKVMSIIKKHDPAMHNKLAQKAGLDIQEKKLTPAELKKREEVARAIERENPDMPMDKKMAIATATAKRVAEEMSDERKAQLKKAAEKLQKGMEKIYGKGTVRGLQKTNREVLGVKESEEMEEAVGSAAKYADKQGMFGGKYTHHDRAIKMTGDKFDAWRKKQAAKRDAEHKAQDPKMAKRGYAQNIVDTGKAQSKATKKGLGKQNISWQQKNSAHTSDRPRKLPEETVNEVSRETLASYQSKASNQVGSSLKRKLSIKKLDTRQAGIKKASDRLARPDFLDLDKDGNKDEPMKQAAKDAKKK